MAVEDVVERMRALGASLPRSDGVARFNELYLDVTVAVRDSLVGDEFADPRFTERLDVVFAELYFAALDAASPPRAWVPLLEARRRTDVAPLQFALAGMNAHINRDLPIALVTVRRELGLDPTGGSPQHSDFLKVNELLARAEQRVKARYVAGVLARLDRLLGRVDDVVAIWKVSRARDAAWTNGQALWRLRDEPDLRDAFLLALDRSVGLASRGLLTPGSSRLTSALRKLRRALGG